MLEQMLAAAQTGEPVAYFHEIKEPNGEKRHMFSASSENPWSHWLATYCAECEVTCTPLYVSPPPPVDADTIIERCAKLIDEGIDRPGIAIKQDTCAHGKFGWEDCEGCCAAAIRALKSSPPPPAQADADAIIERCAQVADEEAAGRGRQQSDASAQNDRKTARDFETMKIAAVHIAADIRALKGKDAQADDWIAKYSKISTYGSTAHIKTIPEGKDAEDE